MQEVALARNYNLVLKSFLSYLPSRILVILNSLIIVPIFAYFLSTSEMSIFQLSIGILNFVCTFSTDWIAKSVLRFYDKYKQNDELNKFFSNIFILQLISYFVIFISYFLFKDIILEKLSIPHNIFFITLMLVIPCGIRQTLYQLVRIFKRTVLYTVSIVCYQISLLLLFFAFSNFVENVISILVAMTIGICFIDILVICKLKIKYELSLKFDKNIIKTLTIYAIPLIFTNLSIWAILHFGKFVFQLNGDFVNTAIVGTAWYFVTNALTPLFSLLLFAIFPIMVKKFEKNYNLKNFMTTVLNVFIILAIPCVCIFTFYSFDIAKIFFRKEYTDLGVLFPFCALTIFFHEFMKIMNLKYHLKNKTYIETMVTVAVAIMNIILYFVLIKNFGILGFGFAMLFSMFTLLVCNSLVNFKSLNFILPKRILKCFLFVLLISICSYLITLCLFFNSTNHIILIIKIITFALFYIAFVYRFKKYIFV